MCVAPIPNHLGRQSDISHQADFQYHTGLNRRVVVLQRTRQFGRSVYQGRCAFLCHSISQFGCNVRSYRLICRSTGPGETQILRLFPSSCVLYSSDHCRHTSATGPDHCVLGDTLLDGWFGCIGRTVLYSLGRRLCRCHGMPTLFHSL